MGLKTEDAYNAELQTILRIAHALKDATGVSYQPSHSAITIIPHTLIDSINLPIPHPLLPLLLGAGFTHKIAASISEAYQLRAEELRRRIQESIVTACRGIAELPVVALASSSDILIKKMVATFTGLYLRRLEQWKEEVLQLIKQAAKASTNVTPRAAFNQEYVPLLEHFFDKNPFPTHADKMFLAQKSNMVYKQIHVWFQNRRNRTKKEGKSLRKKPTYGGAMKPLYQPSQSRIIESDLRVSYTSQLDSSEGATQNKMLMDAIASSSPPHAFPSSYPPNCHYDPFPCKSRPIHFSRPKWRRVSLANISLPLSTNIDELVERFSQLNIRDERFKGSPKLQLQSATAALTVVPSCAPHPSLIVRKYDQPTNIIQRYPLVRAPASSFKVFPDYSHTLKPVTLVPLSVSPDKSELPGKRKTASLPQRFSGRVRSPCRDTPPSESSSTSSASPHLFSPNSEGRSPSSSVSSLPTPPDTGNTQELAYSFG